MTDVTYVRHSRRQLTRRTPSRDRVVIFFVYKKLPISYEMRFITYKPTKFERENIIISHGICIGIKIFWQIFLILPFPSACLQVSTPSVYSAQT